MGAHRNHAPALFSDIGHYLSFDAETGVFTWTKNPGYQDVVGKIAGQTKRRGYVYVQFAGRAYAAHRLAWLFTYGRMPVGIVDHINGITSDNRPCNLREATAAENSRNRRRNAGQILPKGVSFDTRDGCFRAGIRVGGKTVHLGSFSDPESAAAAYAEAAVKWHGDFARVE